MCCVLTVIYVFIDNVLSLGFNQYFKVLTKFGKIISTIFLKSAVVYMDRPASRYGKEMRGGAFLPIFASCLIITEVAEALCFFTADLKLISKSNFRK